MSRSAHQHRCLYLQQTGFYPFNNGVWRPPSHLKTQSLPGIVGCPAVIMSLQEILGGSVPGPGIPWALRLPDGPNLNKCSGIHELFGCTRGLRAGSHWQHPDVCTEKLCHLPEVTQLIAADKACAPHLCSSRCLALDSCSAPALVKNVYFEAHSRF